MRRSLRFCFVVCLGFSLAQVAAAEERLELLYTAYAGSAGDIFICDAAGKNSQNLTDNDAHDTFPAWSPDGQRIVFSSTLGDYRTEQLYVMDADGKNRKQLTRDAGDHTAAAWSPDGKRIAYTHKPDGDSAAIFVMNADGTKPVSLTKGEKFSADPAWSPDGKKIAFASNRSGEGFHLYVMDTDGKNVVELSKANNDLGAVYPAWSPDGQTIAYGDKGRNGSTSVFLTDPAGREHRQWIHTGKMPVWSPDSKTLLFCGFFSNFSEVGLLSPTASQLDGAEPTYILDGVKLVRDCRMAWRPQAKE